MWRRSVSSCVSPGPRVPIGLRELHLQLALLRLGALGEDIENETRAVEHAHAEILRQHAHLRGRELVVKHGEIALVRLDARLQLRHLALAEEGARIGRLLILQYGHDRLAPGGLHEGGKLRHGDLRGALALVHVRRGQPCQRGAFFLFCGILHEILSNGWYLKFSISQPRAFEKRHKFLLAKAMQVWYVQFRPPSGLNPYGGKIHEVRMHRLRLGL